MIADDIRGADFHCHVDLDRDPAALVEACERERIATIAVTTTPKAWPHNQQWMRQSRYVYPALGLHPELVAERYAELDLLERLLPESRLVGEVGLDGSRKHAASMPRQKEVFGRVLSAAQSLGGRVVTIHSRRAANDVITMLEALTTPDKLLPILHWFSGSIASARKAIACGCYFSVNANMLETETGRTLVGSIPLDRLLMETDAPFTSTAGRISAPWDVIQTCDGVARLLAADAAVLRTTVAQNSKRVLAFAGL
ncbi:hydrolase TatD [Bradyrhizobium sp. CCBAU 051011]|uniref:Qat anti-phage system TatD family nuclease QatD n=1 Tax=Bradyrhizobium sp. CCBAU 051011 TaxID=858422 RepID=UPI001373E4A1|nr:Qat anti-phage system TatD family nuclease QatD [Bradyrhizobium sp. CCBAU 051011]QHO73941.1 hydrolase TatD [Bradyrhizobium sp. CCBAU 051011]